MVGWRDIVDGMVGAALRAAAPEGLVRGCWPVGLDGQALAVVGAGKAVVGMVRGALACCAGAAVRGVVVGPPGARAALEEVWRARGAPAGPLEVHEADHPLVTERNIEAAGRVRGFVEREGGGVLLVLLSGGASAHLTLPAGALGLGDVREVTSALMRAGAGIDELNCVRKHCEVLKGGGLAGRAIEFGGFKKVHALVLSDVVGDRLDVIASGPSAPDPTTYAEALEVLDRHGVRDQRSARAVREHLQYGAAGVYAETRKPGDAVFGRVKNSIVGNNKVAVDAVVEEAMRMGWNVEETRLDVTGEAREVGQEFAERVMRLRGAGSRPGRRGARGGAVVWGGETTVTVRGEGRGGRNQEAALAAAIAIDGSDGVGVACFATDGVDGASEAAGAVVDGGSCAAARTGMGLDGAEYLERNDSAGFFSKVGGQIMTGPTGTNVCDVWVGWRMDE